MTASAGVQPSVDNEELSDSLSALFGQGSASVGEPVCSVSELCSGMTLVGMQIIWHSSGQSCQTATSSYCVQLCVDTNFASSCVRQ